MKTEVMTITPELAGKLLATNTRNRRVRDSHVNYFMRLIDSGEFKTTHQGIAIDDDGVLLDGQHRLLAVYRSGLSVKMQVTTGVSRESYQSVDCGVMRTMSDRANLSPKKVAIVNVASSIINVRHGKKLTTAEVLGLSEIIQPIHFPRDDVFFRSAAFSLAYSIGMNAQSRKVRDYADNIGSLVLSRSAENVPPVLHAINNIAGFRRSDYGLETSSGGVKPSIILFYVAAHLFSPDMSDRKRIENIRGRDYTEIIEASMRMWERIDGVSLSRARSVFSGKI